MNLKEMLYKYNLSAIDERKRFLEKLGYKVNKKINELFGIIYYDISHPEGGGLSSDDLSEITFREMIKIVKNSELAIATPVRPEPDFFEIKGKIMEDVLNYSLEKIGKIPVTKDGHIADPVALKQYNAVIDVATLSNKYNILEELRKKFHPNFPYRASIGSSPTVCSVGKRTIEVKNWEWATADRRGIITVSEQIEIAKTGYIVWKDGFAVKSSLKAVEYVSDYMQSAGYVYPGVWQERFKIMYENGIKIFNLP